MDFGEALVNETTYLLYWLRVSGKRRLVLKFSGLSV